jgi:hypothetical protein
MAKKTQPAANTQTESVQGYFKRILKENPRLLKGRSNEELLNRWKEDHKGQEVTNSVRAGLQNAKSALRSKRRKRRAAKQENGQPEAATAHRLAKAAKPAKPSHKLEVLEKQLDDCLSLGKHLDRVALGEVIRLLRHARNKVVWQMGQ